MNNKDKIYHQVFNDILTDDITIIDFERILTLMLKKMIVNKDDNYFLNSMLKKTKEIINHV